jgi:hypothetical protein
LQAKTYRTKQVSTLLDRLSLRPLTDLEKFCNALRATNQGHLARVIASSEFHAVLTLIEQLLILSVSI